MLTESVLAFDVALFKALSASSGSGNVLFSPFGVRSALHVLLLGASGRTAAQLEGLLSCRSGRDMSSERAALLSSSSPSSTLKLATMLCGTTAYSFLPEYEEKVRDVVWGAAIRVADFARAPETSRARLNEWVRQQTENMIADALEPGTIHAGTKLVLLDAVYFKGNWRFPFDESDTREMPFHVSGSESVPVSMMKLEDAMPCEYYRYVEEQRLQILEMPFASGEVSMFVLLPETPPATGSDPLKQLEKELTPKKLADWLDTATAAATDAFDDVTVYLPRFKLMETFELKPILSELGVTDVFDSGKADLPGIFGSDDLFVETATHQACIDVNEKGAEAAAVTCTICADGVTKTKRFVADHPFLFIIMHKKTKSIIFLGRFSSPSS